MREPVNTIRRVFKHYPPIGPAYPILPARASIYQIDPEQWLNRAKRVSIQPLPHQKNDAGYSKHGQEISRNYQHWKRSRPGNRLGVNIKRLQSILHRLSAFGGCSI
jgi:hypothetical protein